MLYGEVYHVWEGTSQVRNDVRDFLEKLLGLAESLPAGDVHHTLMIHKVRSEISCQSEEQRQPFEVLRS